MIETISRDVFMTAYFASTVFLLVLRSLRNTFSSYLLSDFEEDSLCLFSLISF